MRKILILTLLLPLLLCGGFIHARDKGTHSFRLGENQFWLDDKPFQIISGEMHPARVPAEYWRHRVRMIKAMGCNTVACYVMWNYHESRPGEFDFRTGNLEGPALRRSLENYECDVGVASAYGVDETGLIDISDECSEQIALMLGKSSLRIILADHSKFKRKGFCRSLPWNRIHILITTFDPENHAVIRSAQSQGVKVVFVSVPDRNPVSLPLQKRAAGSHPALP